MPSRLIRVLHVDDSEEESILVRELLSDVKGVDFEFHWASDVATAIQTIQKTSFDVCLVDYYLGKDNGLDFTRVAKEQGILTPFILMSGERNQAINRQALKAGVRQCINKNDITPSLLMQAINDAIKD